MIVRVTVFAAQYTQGDIKLGVTLATCLTLSLNVLESNLMIVSLTHSLLYQGM